MTQVVAIMSMSLDGFVADDDGVDEVFDWYFSGDVEVVTASKLTGIAGTESCISFTGIAGRRKRKFEQITGPRQR
jgi:hypothetical protein